MKKESGMKEDGQTSRITQNKVIKFTSMALFRAIRVIAGLWLLLAGVLGVIVCLVAIVDPVGTKMADDNDPFGNPPSRISSLAWATGFGAVGACGFLLMTRRSNPDKQDCRDCRGCDP